MENYFLCRRRKLVPLLLVFLIYHTMSAQCTISSFTVVKTNATCYSNGEIKVSIPTGQTGCETRFATLTPVTGTSNTPVPSQTQTLTFLSAGGDVVFGS